MISHTQYYAALNTVRAYKDQIMKEVSQCEKDADTLVAVVDSKERFKDVKPDHLLYDCHCSIRLFNAIRQTLHFNNIPEVHSCTVSRLCEISLRKFSYMANVGKKTIKELQDLCECAGVTLQP